jgi:hypothetical protein
MILRRTDSVEGSCPRCCSTRILKSRFRGTVVQLLLRVLGVHLYRCCDCESRFYRRVGREVSVENNLPSGITDVSNLR